AIKGGKVDHIPVSPFMFGALGPQTLYGQEPYPFKNDLLNELVEKTDIIVPVHAVAHDFDVIAGKNAEFYRKNEGNHCHITFCTPKGKLTRKIEQYGAVSSTVEFPFKDESDVEKFMSIPYSPPAIDLSNYNYWKEKIGDNGLVVLGIYGNGICFPASWFSPEDFCLNWGLKPELIIKLVAIAAERINNHVKQLCELGVEVFHIVGAEYAITQLGPQGFRQLVKDYDKKLIDIIHGYGGIVHYHCHGRVKRYLEDFIDMGIDLLEPLEAPPWGDTYIPEAQKITQNRICLLGNLDDMEILGKKDKNEIKEIVQAIVSDSDKEKLILGGTSSGIFNENAARNFIFISKIVKSL
ncbi:MAG: uroporphyrinogen decarboxylase family protein, partial [Victivallaceae bacterium]|nr:uroporphyrinogen decarboxylase family protein [Victivallaceae bacterium]